MLNLYVTWLLELKLIPHVVEKWSEITSRLHLDYFVVWTEAKCVRIVLTGYTVLGLLKFN